MESSAASSSASSARTSSSRSASASASGSYKESTSDDATYKTELCRSWEAQQSCKYGNKCRFAHGQTELRPVTRHPKYKTQHCKTFREHGHCPYGRRCKFIHDDSETSDVKSAPGLLERSGSINNFNISPRSLQAMSLTPLPSEELSSKLSLLRPAADGSASPSTTEDRNVSPRSPRSPIDNMSPFQQSPRSPEIPRHIQPPSSLPLQYARAPRNPVPIAELPETEFGQFSGAVAPEMKPVVSPVLPLMGAKKGSQKGPTTRLPVFKDISHPVSQISE